MRGNLVCCSRSNSLCLAGFDAITDCYTDLFCDTRSTEGIYDNGRNFGGVVRVPTSDEYCEINSGERK